MAHFKAKSSITLVLLGRWRPRSYNHLQAINRERLQIASHERGGGVGMRLEYIWYALLPAVPVAYVLHALGVGPLITFLVAGLGIVPLAAFLGRATDSLACHLGPWLGGLLSASFGNAAELIIGLFALREGLTSVVKASLAGSLIGNALFVLGLSLLAGGLRNGRQRFDRVTVGLRSTLLVLASIGLTFPSVLYHHLGPEAETYLSQEVAIVFLITYVLDLVFSLLASRSPVVDQVNRRGETAKPPEWGAWLAAGILLGTTILVGFLSDILVEAIEQSRDLGYLEAWGMSEVFVGVVLIALFGNAAENSTAVQMAYRNKIDLALHIALGSSLQISLLIMPILVFASLVLSPAPLDLHFTLLEVLAVGASVIVVAFVAADGESHWMEGVLLLAVYIIMALAFYHLPAPAP
jgi:Ca2+:H+ antiporter